MHCTNMLSKIIFWLIVSIFLLVISCSKHSTSKYQRPCDTIFNKTINIGGTNYIVSIEASFGAGQTSNYHRHLSMISNSIKFEVEKYLNKISKRDFDYQFIYLHYTHHLIDRDIIDIDSVNGIHCISYDKLNKSINLKMYIRRGKANSLEYIESLDLNLESYTCDLDDYLNRHYFVEDSLANNSHLILSTITDSIEYSNRDLLSNSNSNDSIITIIKNYR